MQKRKTLKNQTQKNSLNTSKYIAIFLLMFFFAIFSSQTYAVDWQNESYNLRREITFSNGSREKEPIILNLTSICGTTKCNPNRDDIFITYYNGTQTRLEFELLDEEYSQNPTPSNAELLHLIIPDSANSLYVYYNSSTSVPMNSSVFLWYDSFEDESGTSDTWSQYSICTGGRTFASTTTNFRTGKQGAYKNAGSNSAISRAIAPTGAFYAELMVYNATGFAGAQGMGSKVNGGSACSTEGVTDAGVFMIGRTDVQYAYKKSSAGNYIDSGTDFTKEVFHSLRYYIGSDADTFYFDDILLSNQTTLHWNPTGINSFQILAGIVYDAGYNKVFDDMRISYNEFQSYNVVNVITYGGEEEPSSAIIIQDITLFNISREAWDTTMNQFSDLFYIGVNATYDGLPAEDAQCNYTTNNISHVFTNVGGNFSLTATNSIELITTHELSNNLHDLIRFEVCVESGTAKDITYYINDNTTIFKTVDSTLIPKCTSGFYNEVNITKEFLTDGDINLSIRCPACVGINTVRVRELRGNNVNAVIQRRQGIVVDELDYNVSSGLFEDFDALHNFYTSNGNSINISCNTTSDTLSITVVPRLPVSVFNEIIVDSTTIYSFKVNNTITESGLNYAISGSCNGLDIVKRELNVTYSNDTFIKSNNQAFISLTNEDLDAEDLYKAILYCENLEGNSSVKVQTFWTNDTIDPAITWTLPNDLNTTSIDINTSTTTDILFSDINLFAFNCSMYNPNQVLKYNWELLDINISSYSMQESFTPDMTGVWSLNCTVADDHTKNSIDDVDYNIENGDKTFVFTYINIGTNKQSSISNITIEYQGQYAINDPIIEKDKDRYRFGHSYFLLEDRFKEEVKHKYKVKCKNIIYRANSDYTAHFVCPNEKAWVDFESDIVLRYEVETDDDSATINFWTKSDETIIFNSLGGLNEFEESRTFTVTQPVVVNETSSLLVGVCPSTLSGTLILWLVIGICLFFIMMAFVFRLAFIGIMASIGLVMLSRTVVGCDLTMGYVVGVIGLVTMMTFALSDWW